MVCYVYYYMNENIHLLDTGNFLGNFLSYCANGVTKQLHNDLSAQGPVCQYVFYAHAAQWGCFLMQHRVSLVVFDITTVLTRSGLKIIITIYFHHDTASTAPESTATREKKKRMNVDSCNQWSGGKTKTEHNCGVWTRVWMCVCVHARAVNIRDGGKAVVCNIASWVARVLGSGSEGNRRKENHGEVVRCFTSQMGAPIAP